MNCPRNGDSDWRWRCARSMPGSRATTIEQLRRAVWRQPHPRTGLEDPRPAHRTIRLVQSGFALMRGGYRALLRQARRHK